MVDQVDPSNHLKIPESMSSQELLKPVIRKGKVLEPLPSLTESRSRAMDQLKHFQNAILRFDNPQQYLVGLEHQLYELKSRMVLEARRARSSSGER